MKKKLLSLALIAGAASATYAAIKLIAERKAEKDEFEIPERNDISDAFDEAWYEREHSIITEEEFAAKRAAILFVSEEENK